MDFMRDTGDKLAGSTISQHLKELDVPPLKMADDSQI